MCEPCYRAALSRRGICQGCGAERRLVSPPGPGARSCAGCAEAPPLATCRSCGAERRLVSPPRPGARSCAGCAEAPPLATCRSCGAEERPYLDGCCVRCALAIPAAELTGGPEGQLRAVYEAIVAAPQPYSAHNWLRCSVAAELLGEVATGQLALTHEALDAHPARRGADYLRHLLVANGVLPAHDDALVRLEAWVGKRLANVEDQAQRRLLRSYATWRVLRRARQRAEAAGAPRTATRYAKVNLNSAIAFLGFLAARQADLAGATQADLDDWLAEGPPSAPEVRDFLGWATDRRLIQRFDLPGRRQEGPVAADDERWSTARSLLHDERTVLGDRVAGLLVLLYGQQLGRIAALTRDQVELTREGCGCTWEQPRSMSPRLWANFWPVSLVNASLMPVSARPRSHRGFSVASTPGCHLLLASSANACAASASSLPPAGVLRSSTWLLTYPRPCWRKPSACPRALLCAGPAKLVPTGPYMPPASPAQSAPEPEAEAAAAVSPPTTAGPPEGAVGVRRTKGLLPDWQKNQAFAAHLRAR